jgi:adenylate cyclase
MERKLTAILCADVHGYSRLMGEDEEATLRTLSAYRKIIDSLIENHRGRFVNSAGDSVLAEFTSVVEAVNCTVDIQTALRAENGLLPPERRMEFRIGVNLGDVMVEGEQIYGDGVNVAARLESLAEPGGICISRTVHDSIKNKMALDFNDLGEQAVKNIAEPVHVWRIVLNGAASQAQIAPRRRHYWRRGVLSLTGVAIVVGTILVVQHVSLKPPRTHASSPAWNPHPSPLPQQSGRWAEALPLPNIPSIAVLPFTNLSGDPQQEYFSDGISNQLIEDLSRLPGLFVIARNSSFAYKGKSTSEHEIGGELGVKYVLEGSIRRASDHVRIGVELVDAGSGTEMWAQHFDRPLKDIFALQDEIVGKIVTTLGLIFKLDRLNGLGWVVAPSTNNLEAFDDFLRAASYIEAPGQSGGWIRDNLLKARSWLEKAIALDPNFAQAYAFLAYTYWGDAWNQWSANPAADIEHSRELALKALALDDSNGDALRNLSVIDFIQGRFDQAIAEAERAVAANPNSASYYEALSDALNCAGRSEEALQAGEKAVRLDPVRADYFTYTVGDALVELKRYQEAISILHGHLNAYPNDVAAHLFLLVAYTERGQQQDARNEASEVMRISPHFTLAANEKTIARLHPRWIADERKAGLK